MKTFQYFQIWIKSGPKSNFFGLKLILNTFHENFKKYSLQSVETLSASQKLHSDVLLTKKFRKLFNILKLIFFKFEYIYVYIRIWSSWLTFTVSQGMKANIKISQFSRFQLRSEYPIQVKIWKWLKLLNSVPFIKKPLVNQVYIRIWTFWLTFTVLQWMKKNSKTSQFSGFLLRSGYAILVKIWKWLKLLNSVPFIKKRLLNHVYIRIWSSWLTFTVSQGMKSNIKISQFSRFLLRSEYPIQVKI